MTMWLRIREWVRKLFGIRPEMGDNELQRAEMDAMRYFDIQKENITAIVASSISTLAFGDADATVVAKNEAVTDSPRLELLGNVLKDEMFSAKRNIAAALGVGMIATIPYSVDAGMGRKIYTATVTKDRFYITGMQGDDITSCVVIADVMQLEKDTYFRWTDYAVENGVYIIRNKATKNGDEIPLTSVDRWAQIEPEIRIAGVDRLPIGIFRCPTANRRPDDVAGVPITFGCDATLDKIAKTLADIETEFERKKAKVFVDRSLIKTDYDENGNAIKNDFSDSLYVKFENNDKMAVDIFDPSLRESSYYTKLLQHFAFLEKEIGVSRGILTDSESKNATATEIRRAMYQTFCLLDDVHGEFERYMNGLMYGVNVLCNFYGLDVETPYKIKYDWSYALLEDTQSTFNQMMQALSVGAERPAELRMFLHPDEDLEEAQAVIDEIKQQSLMAAELIGQSANDTEPED